MYSSYPVCLDTSFRWVSEIEYLLYFSALLCFCSTEHGIDGETIDVVDYVFFKAMEHAKLWKVLHYLHLSIVPSRTSKQEAIAIVCHRLSVMQHKTCVVFIVFRESIASVPN